MSTTPDPLELSKKVMIAAATAAGRVLHAKVDGPRTGSEFGRALCQHFGLDAGKVSGDFHIRTGGGDILSVDLNIFLTPGDFQAIGSIMADTETARIAKNSGSTGPDQSKYPLYDPITGTAR